MKVTNVRTKGAWRDVADSCNTTINKGEGTKEPSSSWKRRMLLCEHSPIRQLIIKWKWRELLYWVSVHFVRHKFGIEHWVRTQRTDRTGLDRNQELQSALVEHEAEANAQAIINISRKRLCSGASPETRQAWLKVLDEIEIIQPELRACCVPDCVYRGHCFEFYSCGFHKTEKYQEMVKAYREGINQ